METTKQPLYRIIRTFKDKGPTFLVKDELADFEGRAPHELYFPEVNYSALFEHYGLDQTDFTERVANLTNPEALESDPQEPLYINWISSVDVIASRKGLLPKKLEGSLVAIGLVITKDNQIVLGIRGARGRKITQQMVDMYALGLYGLPPGGSVKFKPKYDTDPLTDTVIEEFEEELGHFNITSQNLVGIFEAFQPGPRGIKFISKITTDATLAQIQKTNVEANKLFEDFYKELLSKGVSENEATKEAAQELVKKGLPPDAWEHTGLVGICNDPWAIKKLVKTQPHCGIGAGALMTYAATL